MFIILQWYPIKCTYTVTVKWHIFSLAFWSLNPVHNFHNEIFQEIQLEDFVKIKIEIFNFLWLYYLYYILLFKSICIHLKFYLITCIQLYLISIQIISSEWFVPRHWAKFKRNFNQQWNAASLMYITVF